MKKFLTIAMMITAMCILAGCGSSKEKAAEATTESTAAQIIPVEMNAEDYVELGEYKGLTVEGATTKVTAEEVDNQVQSLADDYIDYKEITDRDIVKDGDYVNMDYTSTIDGKESEDYTDSDIDMQIGAGDFNLGDDFNVEQELIGAKVGETKTLNLTFPDDYDDTNVAGKKCTMEVTVNKIEEEVVPEINDAFIKENTDCKTVKEYRKQVRKELQDEYATEAEQTNQDALWQQIEENCTIKKEFSEDMIKQETANQKAANQEWADYFGLSVDEFMEQYYSKTLEEYAKDCLKKQAVQDLLAKAEGIEVTDQEYKDEIQTYITEYGYESEEEILSYYTEDEIKNEIIYSKLMTTLMSYTTVTEPKATTDTAEEDATEASSTEAAENETTADGTTAAESTTAESTTTAKTTTDAEGTTAAGDTNAAEATTAAK